MTSFEVLAPEEATIGDWISCHVMVKKIYQPKKIENENEQQIINDEAKNNQPIINDSKINQPLMNYFKNNQPIADESKNNQPIKNYAGDNQAVGNNDNQPIELEGLSNQNIHSGIDDTLLYKLEFKETCWSLKGRPEGFTMICSV